MNLLRCTTCFFLFFVITTVFGQKNSKSFDYKELKTAPNLVFIEGRTFDMGYGTYAVRRVTVSSFYIDATEVWNKHYRAFDSRNAKIEQSRD